MILFPKIVSNSITSLYTSSHSSNTQANNNNKITSPSFKGVLSSSQPLPLLLKDDDSDSDSTVELSSLVKQKSSLSSCFNNNIEKENKVLQQQLNQQQQQYHDEVKQDEEDIDQYMQLQPHHRQHDDDDQPNIITKQHNMKQQKKTVRFHEVVDILKLNEEPMNDIERELAFYSIIELNIIRKSNKTLGKFLRCMNIFTITTLFQQQDQKQSIIEDDGLCIRGLEKILSSDMKLMLRTRRKNLIHSILIQQQQENDNLRGSCSASTMEEEKIEFTEQQKLYDESLREISLQYSNDCMRRAYYLAQEDCQYVQQNVVLCNNNEN